MIKLTENYAIKSDGSLNWQIFELKTIDPTNAPGWERRLAEAVENGEPAPDPTPRTEWIGLESYHGNLEQALFRIVDLEGLRYTGDDMNELTFKLIDVYDAIDDLISRRESCAINES